MDSTDKPTKRRWPLWKTIALSVVALALSVGVFLYYNYNRLLSRALMASFESSIMADVYELKFDNLLVNFVDKSIKVSSVSLLPREKPLQDYPYINSSFGLTTENLLLEGVNLRTLLRSKKLILRRMLIDQPDIKVMLSGKRSIMLPFGDTTKSEGSGEGVKKRAVESFLLTEFQLINASFHVRNEQKQREFDITGLGISLRDIAISGKPGEYEASFSGVTLSIGDLKGHFRKGPIKELDFLNFEIGLDSPGIRLSLDTAIYRLHDFRAGFRDLDVQTADDQFHLAVDSFNLAYRDQSIDLRGVSFKPNVSHDELQKKFKYQHSEFSGSVGSLVFEKIDFDSLLFAQKLFVGKILLDDVKAFVYKDRTKPMDTAKYPIYLGQTVAGISMPLRIESVKATRVQLENTEKKPDSTLAKAVIGNASLEAGNITNLSYGQGLMMKADAYLMNKAHFNATLNFHYRKRQFTFEGTMDTFALPDLNPLIAAYTPARILKGTSDHIRFSGLAEETRASGTMRFLYHDLEVDLNLKDQARWKSSVIAFAANSLLQSSNPPDAESPPREVKFQVERDMNKGFVNVITKSLLNGLKETMIMSKDNRKAYQEEKKRSKGGAR